MSEYVPTTEEIAGWWAHKGGSPASPYYASKLTKRAKEFDRWLATHDAEKHDMAERWKAVANSADDLLRAVMDALNIRPDQDPVIEARRIAAALAEQGETEWEYGYELIEPDTRDVFERDGHYISTAFAYRAAKMRIHEERHPGVPGLQYSLIQRAKAGPWLPVPGSTVRESDSGVRDSDNEESEGE